MIMQFYDQEEELETLRRVFTKLDTNKDGFLSIEEIDKGLDIVRENREHK